MATMLVVDDDLLFHRIMRFMLRRSGHLVVTASSVAEGLAQLAKQQIDLVFVDLLIPGTGGLYLLEQVRADKRYADLPVVVLTASAQWDDRVTAVDQGATAFLQKPTSSWELTETVASLLPSLSATVAA